MWGGKLSSARGTGVYLVHLHCPYLVTTAGVTTPRATDGHCEDEEFDGADLMDGFDVIYPVMMRKDHTVPLNTFNNESQVCSLRIAAINLDGCNTLCS